MIERVFVEEGIKKVRLDEYFKRTLDRAGYGGMDIKRTPMGTQITVFVERPGIIIGRDGKRIREITEEVSARKELDNPQIDVQHVEVPELNAQLMASRLAKLIERGWHFRRAGRLTLHRIMDAGALGCEITISGKLTGARARTEKIVEGYIKHCGGSIDEIVKEGFAVAMKKAGVIGVKVRIVPPDAKIPDLFQLKIPEEEAKAEATAETNAEGEEVEAGEERAVEEGAEEKEETKGEGAEERAERADTKTAETA